MSASFPYRRGPRRTGTCPCQGPPVPRAPRGRHASHSMPPGSLRIPTMRNAARGRSQSPSCAAAAVARRPPVPRLRPPSPGTRRVRRLDSHRAPRADLVLPNDVPSRSSDVSLLPARRRVTPASRSGTGRHMDGGASALLSTATTPQGRTGRADRRSVPPASRRGDGALRHEPVITRNGAPALARLAPRGTPRTPPPASASPTFVATLLPFAARQPTPATDGAPQLATHRPRNAEPEGGLAPRLLGRKSKGYFRQRSS